MAPLGSLLFLAVQSTLLHLFALYNVFACFEVASMGGRLNLNLYRFDYLSVPPYGLGPPKRCVRNRSREDTSREPPCRRAITHRRSMAA